MGSEDYMPTIAYKMDLMLPELSGHTRILSIKILKDSDHTVRGNSNLSASICIERVKMQQMLLQYTVRTVHNLSHLVF